MFRKKRNKDYDDYLDYDHQQEEYLEDQSIGSYEEQGNKDVPFDNQHDEFDYYHEGYESEYGNAYSNLEDEENPHYYNETLDMDASESSYQNSNEAEVTYLRSRRHSNGLDEGMSGDYNEAKGQRTRYNARIDRFLNNGIIIIGVLLIIVLVIAFML